ncbi:MAG: glycoside hydrolase family 3 protein [Treponema sp.]|jgi:beta-N-acetylhexosaminidase|nr:glycoside hydrolase family 3 protein [Treponema sp.]
MRLINAKNFAGKYASVFCLLLLSACFGRTESLPAEDASGVEEEIFIAPDPIQIRAAEIVSSLDDRILTAQLFICAVDGRGKLSEQSKTLLTRCPAGGMIFFGYNLNTPDDAIRSFIAEIVSAIKNEADLAPFVSVDHEGGLVNRLRGIAPLPAAHSYWELAMKDDRQKALDKIEADSFRSGEIIKSLGFNFNFAPVAEYLNDDNRDFFDSRTYGPDPFFVSEAAAVFIRGMEQAGVLCVIKHFPGSAGEDPHFFRSVLKGDRAALTELVSPFASLIKSGTRVVMTSHSLVPAMDSEIASLSPVIMKDWLRGELGFNGIIVCDDFSMAAAGSKLVEEAAVSSVAAGADMVLVWPSDIARTHHAFLSALEDGRLSRERLMESAQRIIYEKIRMGLIESDDKEE